MIDGLYGGSNGMRTLAFDTSSEYLSVFCTTEKKRSEVSFFGAFQHAEKLIPLIREALKKAGLQLEQCDQFVIGLGPGSFTGLRVGFATLQGLAQSTGKPCFGIPSLDATALWGRDHEGPLAVVMDARRGKLYLGLYEFRGGGLIRLEPYRCLSPREVMEKLGKYKKGKIWLTGDGLVRYRDSFEKEPGNVLLAPQKFWYPHSSNLYELFKMRRKMLKPIPISKLIPFYLQEPHIGPVKSKIHVR